MINLRKIPFVFLSLPLHFLFPVHLCRYKRRLNQMFNCERCWEWSGNFTKIIFHNELERRHRGRGGLTGRRRRVPPCWLRAPGGRARCASRWPSHWGTWLRRAHTGNCQPGSDCSLRARGQVSGVAQASSLRSLRHSSMPRDFRTLGHCLLLCLYGIRAPIIDSVPVG